VTPTAPRPTILVTWMGYADDPRHARALDEAGFDVRYAPRVSDRTPDELVELLGDAVGVIADADPFDASVIERAAALRVIGRVGVGLDSVDIAAATRRGIAVTTAPGIAQAVVAEHAVALMLALLRRLVELDADVRAGGWTRGGAMTPWQLTGSTVGIVGYGQIGRGVAQRLQGFETTILAHDPMVAEADGVELVSLDELIARSDVVSLNTALTDETRHLVDRDRLRAMKPDAILVNTARGPVVDENALLEALSEGWIRGAALDVLETEPPSEARSAALAAFPNVVLSPHIAGLSDRSALVMTIQAIDCVVGVLRGERPATLVNQEALAAAVHPNAGG
jgi:D-3-phosphoglycerate dehydrogenase